MAQEALSAAKAGGEGGAFLPDKIFTICFRGFPSLRTDKPLGHVCTQTITGTGSKRGCGGQGLVSQNVEGRVP